MKKLLGGKLKYLIIFAVLGTAGLSIFLAKSCLSGSENTRFEKYIDKIFYQEISSNTLNLHYTLAYPEDYGIRDYQISLGTFEPKALEDDLIRTEKLNKELERFDSARLSQENRIIYDILSLEFSSRLSLGQNYLLQEPLGPNLGIQAQLPVLLAEYAFRTSADIKDYFSLLASVPEYFEEILDFERKKSEEGLFMSDASADRIILQCESFLETSKDNYLYGTFNERIEELLNAKRISRHQADSFIEMHDKLMDQYIFPAYRSLAEGLENLKGSGKNAQGLANWEGGKEYYEYLLKKYGQEALSAYATRIRDLEETITNLQGAFSVQQTKMNELTEQNQGLLAEKVEYQNKKRTLSGREKSLESRENVKLPVRRLFYPLVNRLIAEAKPGTKYTRTQIQEEFLRELDSFPELKPAVRDALHTPKKAKNNTPFELTGWAMEEIRLALGEYAQTSPGRDRES